VNAFNNAFPRLNGARTSSSILKKPTAAFQPTPSTFGSSIIAQRSQPLRDILGLGPAEIAITLVVALVLFGPETLKSLSKDVGRAAAELKEIPKTFKEGMEEGAESAQVTKMKAIAAEKRKKRDAKMAAKKGDDDEDDDDDDEDDKAEEKK
jgi:Sec-independent protein translocase protein TatA